MWLESFLLCDEANAFSADRNWHVPTRTLKDLIHTASMRHPAVDNDSSLNLAALASLDKDAARLHLPKTIYSHPIPVPSSMLERWEMKQRQTLGLTSQLDWFFGCGGGSNSNRQYSGRFEPGSFVPVTDR